MFIHSEIRKSHKANTCRLRLTGLSRLSITRLHAPCRGFILFTQTAALATYLITIEIRSEGTGRRIQAPILDGLIKLCNRYLTEPF